MVDKYEKYHNQAIADCIGTDTCLGGWVFQLGFRWENLVWITTDYTKPTEAEYDAAVTARENGEAIQMLRDVRNGKLAETDHWAYQDTPAMTTAQTNYRQALRDITDTYSDLTTVVWPTKP